MIIDFNMHGNVLYFFKCNVVKLVECEFFVGSYIVLLLPIKQKSKGYDYCCLEISKIGCEPLT